jgi:hypothetical protein
VNRSALTAVAGAAGALVIVAALAGGYLLGHGHVTTRTVIRTVTAPVTHTRTVTASPAVRHHKRHHAAIPSPAPPPATAVLYNCTGQAVTQPADYILTCADAGINLSGLIWSGWGSTRATATGQMATNDCSPDCAQGTYHYTSVQVIASGLQNGAYTALNITGDCSYGCSWHVGRQGPGS